MDYRIILYIVFGVLPSLAWIAFYLRKDLHPEPKKMIFKAFLLGVAVTLPVFLIQIGFKILLDRTGAAGFIYSLTYWFLIIAFSEEFFKYLVFRAGVLSSREFDEPVDAMIYMVMIALGFAALENILYLLPPIDQINTISFSALVNRTVVISFVRFIGSTFLHTLCSATVGYFLALSICEAKRSKALLILIFGIFIAVLLHGLYNFSIMTVAGPLKIIIPVAILVFLTFFVISGFEKLKKIKSICKLN